MNHYNHSKFIASLLKDYNLTITNEQANDILKLIRDANNSNCVFLGKITSRASAWEVIINNVKVRVKYTKKQKDKCPLSIINNKNLSFLPSKNQKEDKSWEEILLWRKVWPEHD